MNWRNRFRREIRREIMRGQGLDPAVPQWPEDFEVYASTPTSGGFHSWLTTNYGRVRKPNGSGWEEKEHKLITLA